VKGNSGSHNLGKKKEKKEMIEKKKKKEKIEKTNRERSNKNII
jgi:hypothetical protein